MAEVADGARTWLRDEPMPRAPASPDAGWELVVRAFWGAGGRVEVQDAVIRREAGGRVEPAAVLAWARPPGDPAREQQWSVLAVWLDAVDGGSGTRAGHLEWRGGWMTYVPELLEPSGPWRQTSEYWYAQRHAAVVQTLHEAGIQPRTDTTVQELQELADRVRHTVQTLTLPNVSDFTPPPFDVSIDLPGRRVVLDLRHWTGWGPRQVLSGRLQQRFPGVEFWSSAAYFSLPSAATAHPNP
jgi:hypothetical protein